MGNSRGNTSESWPESSGRSSYLALCVDQTDPIPGHQPVSDPEFPLRFFFLPPLFCMLTWPSWAAYVRIHDAQMHTHERVPCIHHRTREAYAKPKLRASRTSARSARFASAMTSHDCQLPRGDGCLRSLDTSIHDAVVTQVTWRAGVSCKNTLRRSLHTAIQSICDPTAYGEQKRHAERKYTVATNCITSCSFPVSDACYEPVIAVPV